MAVCNTPQFGSNTCPQLQLEVNVTSQTGGVATLTWILRYVAHGHAFSTSYAKQYSASVAGVTVASGNYDINGKTGTYEIARGTKTVNKGATAQSVSFSCSMAFNAYWGSTYGGTKSASSSLSVSAKTTYTITYNANGGSGAPGSQVRTWGQSDFKLSTVKPTRTGYTFQGWATSSGGAVAYQPGAAYGGDANLNLYAIWEAITYSVTYNANGGSGAPATQTKTYGTNLTLSSTKPTRTNYIFQGWGTSASSTTVNYAAGAVYSTNASITLYAIWKLAYKTPRITSFTVDRCTSTGAVSETGTYALVKFSWATDRTVSGIKIEYKKDTATSWTAVTVTGSGTSGSVSEAIGGGGLSTEYTYNIRVTVSDSGGSYNPIKSIAPIAYDIDFLKGGGGVAIGQPASRKGFDVNMNTTVKKQLEVVGSATMDGMLTVEGQFRPLGTLNGQLKNSATGGTWIKARDNATIRNTGSNSGSFMPLGSMKTPKGAWNIGTIGENLYFTYDLDTRYNANNNGTDKSIMISTEFDYITTKGTSGIWTYRKWASGIAECWTTNEYALGNYEVRTASWSGGYESALVTLPAYPFTFTSQPHFNFYCIGADGAALGDYKIIYRQYDGGALSPYKSKPPQFKFWRGSAATFGHPRVTMYAIGRFQ